MVNTSPYRVHAAALPEGVLPGLWADTAAKLLLLASEDINKLDAENSILRATLSSMIVSTEQAHKILEK